MIVNKSFKYNSVKHPKIHTWVEALGEREFSEAVRELIEKDCGGKASEPNPVLEELRQLRQQIEQLRVSGPVTSRQEAELIRLDEAVQGLQEKAEYKEVDKTQIKNRYGI